MTDDRILAFRDALAEGDDADAVERFSAFGDALSVQSARARALQTVARGVVARTGTDGDLHGAAQRFLQAAHDAQQARVRVEGEFFLYTQDGPSAGDVADTVDELVAADGELREAAAALREEAAAGGVDLPPAVAVFGPDDLSAPAGETVTATYTVANVGTVAVPELSVTVAAEGVDASVDPATVSGLDPGEEATATVEVATDDPGDYELTLGAAGDEASDDLGVAVAVLGPGDYLETARAAVRDAIDRLERVRENADGELDGIAGLLDKLRTVEDRIDDIEEQLDADSPPGVAVANRIRSATRTLGAVLNQIDALEGTSLTARQTAVVGYDAGEAVDDLATARDLVDDDPGRGGGGKAGSPGR